MGWKAFKYKATKYSGVYGCCDNKTQEITYSGQVTIDYRKKQKHDFKTEIEAAKWVDIQLMRNGKDPKNIYKKK